MRRKNERAAGRDDGIGCDRARELFYDFAADELGSEDERLLSLHEASCSSCGAEFREWRRLRIALANSKVAPAADFKAGVMARLQEVQARPGSGRPIPWIMVWQQGWASWAKGIAAAAVVLALMAGAARLPAVGTLIAQHTNKPNRVIVQPTPPNNPNIAFTPNDPDDSPGVQPPANPGGDNGGGNNGGNDNEAPTGQANPPATPSGPGEPEITSNGQGAGERVFLNKTRVITTTTIKVVVDDIGQARTNALNIAGSFNAALSSETPAQNNGHPILLLRFTVDPGQAGAFLDRLGSLGGVVKRDTESKNVTDEFARTLEAYQALKAQQAAAPEADRRQYDSQINNLELQLQGWDDTSGKQVVILWVE